MSTGFENKKSKTKASFAPSIDSKDITTKFQEYFTQVKDPRAPISLESIFSPLYKD